MSDAKLQVIPLGGLGEFGMNCLALRYGDDIVVIDAGMMFPEDELPGIDLVTPDFTYLTENREHVRALILTHGHEDHIGAVPFLLAQMDLPVYGTAFTLALVKRRVEEHELASPVIMHEVAPGQTLRIGPFSIEFIHVTHSIVQATALAITTPLGIVVHSGDFKVDPTPPDNRLFDLHTLAEYGRRGVLLLLSDSTNADRPGYTESEQATRPRLEDIFHRAEGRVIVSCFSSSIHRIQQIVDLAQESGRKLAFLGRSMVTGTEIAHSLGLLRLPDGLLLRPQEIMQLPRQRVAVAISGSQGEPVSALARVAVNDHRHLVVQPGDTVVLSSRIIPGNEKAIYRMMNHLARQGADVIYGQMSPPVHVSGHASAEELRLLLNLVRPRYFVPIHGEYRQLAKHASLASHLRDSGLEQVFVLEAGETLEVDRWGARKGERVPVGRVCIDSGAVDEVVEDVVIRDRRHLAEEGIVLPVIAIDKRTGKLEGTPEIVSRGFALTEEGSEIFERARQVVIRTLETATPEERTDSGIIKEKIRTDLRRFI
ncbi:MAG: ribonuclease J, partial [Bryobacteraceae bacterium]